MRLLFKRGFYSNEAYNSGNTVFEYKFKVNLSKCSVLVSVAPKPKLFENAEARQGDEKARLTRLEKSRLGSISAQVNP